MAAIIPLLGRSPPPTVTTVVAPEATIVGEAGAALGGHRVVKKDSASLIQYASSADILDAGKVLGLTTGAASAGQPSTILRSGEIEDPSWSWTLDTPIFLSTDGLLTQVAPSYPSSSFSQIVAFPITATKILLSLREPIRLVL